MKVLNLLITISFFFSIKAQVTFTAKIADKLKRDNRNENPVLITSDESGYITYSNQSRFYNPTIKEVQLAKHDNNGKQLIKVDLEPTFNGKAVDFMIAVYRENKIILLSAFEDKKQNCTQIISQTVDPKTLKLANDAKSIKSIASSIPLNIQLTTTKGSENIFLAYDNGTEGRKVKTLGAAIWDGKLKELYSKEEVITDKDIIVEHICPTRNGDFHIVTNSNSPKDINAFKIFSFFTSKRAFAKYDFLGSSKKIADLTVEISNDGTIYIIGLYSDTDISKVDFSTPVRGYFFQKINAQNKLEKPTFYPFANSTIETANNKKGDKVEIDFLKLLQIEQSANGLYLVFQKTFMQGERSNHSTIVIAKTASDGKSEWESVLYKSSGAKLEDMPAILPFNNTLILLHVDFYNNTGLGNNAFILTQVDSSGKLKHDLIFKEDQFDNNIESSETNILNNNTAIVYMAQRVNQTVQFAILTFK